MRATFTGGDGRDGQNNPVYPADVENHAYAVALHMMYYNFVKLHGKLRMSPAMTAGMSDRL